LEDLMPLPRRLDEGFVASTLAIALLSVLMGAGTAILAVQALVSSAGPNDQIAVQNGPSTPVDPNKIIIYGGS
jgi:hypothetical protein